MTAITLTKDTLSKSKFYIRDVLRNNITDTRSRTTKGIFAGNPPFEQFTSSSYPLVAIIQSDLKRDKMVFSNAKYKPQEFTTTITVWSLDLLERDTLSDTITNVLSDPTSTDGTSTMAQTGIYFLSATSDDSEAYFGEVPDIIHVKKITAKFKYTS